MELRRGTYRVIASAAIVGSAFMVAVGVPMSSPKQGASRWAAELTQAERVSYARPDRMAGLPTEYRRAILGGLDLSTRTAVWHGVFGQFRRAHSVTAEQAVLLDRAESLLTPVLMQAEKATTLDGDLQKSVESVRADVRASLGAEAEAELFLNAGPSRQGQSLPRTESMLFALRQQRSVIVASNFLVPQLLADYGPCGCSQESDWCDGGTYCADPANTTYGSCTHHGGCGTWFGWTCDGICRYP